MKNEHAVALGKLGGKKGGKRRFALMTEEEKSELGKLAAKARWAKKRRRKRLAQVSVSP